MKYIILNILLAILVFNVQPATGQGSSPQEKLDKKVEKFLGAHRSGWHDMNVPYRDGQLLHDLIVENNYTRALEIGTSTGHSAIWLAWALSKTGGRLITVEINESRYKQALENFKKAGLSEYIDARLVDAHDLVKELEGPFDFVFSDADKDWYTQYFKDLAPKMTVGGCYTAHNVTRSSWPGIAEFLEYIQHRDDFKTSIETSRSSGISISYKKTTEEKD
jgi:predicted O-methyltransferase YrrM